MASAPIDLLDLPADREALHALAEIDAIDDALLERGLDSLGLRPTRASWGSYLYWHALIVGVVLLAAGAVFFVAANWSGLSGMVRLGIVGGAMVSCTVVGGFLGESLAGRAVSLLGGLLFGPTMAVYSQIYQTGADPWELFAIWTVVMLAYGAFTRFAGAWVVSLVLGHIAGFAWVSQELGSNFYGEPGAPFIAGLALVDALVVLGVEFLAPEENRRSVARTAGYFALATLLPFGVMLSVGELEAGGGPGAALLGLLLVAIWAVYRWRRPDLVMLAGFAGMVTTMVTCALGKFVLDTLDAELFGIAFLGVAICVQVWLLTRWLLGWRASTQSAGQEVAP